MIQLSLFWHVINRSFNNYNTCIHFSDTSNSPWKWDPSCGLWFPVATVDPLSVRADHLLTHSLSFLLAANPLTQGSNCVRS